MNDSTKDGVWAVLTGVVMVLVVVGGCFYSMPWFKRYFMLRSENAARDRTLHELACQKSQIDEQIHRFRNDDEFVKSVAREKRLYHPHEYVIIFGDQEASK